MNDVWFVMVVIFTILIQVITGYYIINKVRHHRNLPAKFSNQFYVGLSMYLLAIHSASNLSYLLNPQYISLVRAFVYIGSIAAILAVAQMVYHLNLLFQESFFTKYFSTKIPFNEIVVFTFVTTMILIAQLVFLRVEYTDGMYIVNRSNEITRPFLFGGGFILFLEFLLSFNTVSKSSLRQYRVRIMALPLGLMISLFILFGTEIGLFTTNFFYLVPLAIGNVAFLSGLYSSPSILLFPPKSFEMLTEKVNLHPEDSVIITTEDLKIIYINRNFSLETGYNYQVLTNSLTDVLQDMKIITSPVDTLEFEEIVDKPHFKLELAFTTRYGSRVVYELEKIYRKYIDHYFFILRNVSIRSFARHQSSTNNLDIEELGLVLQKKIHDLRNTTQFLEIGIDLLEGAFTRRSVNDLPIVRDTIEMAKHRILDISEQLGDITMEFELSLTKVEINEFMTNVLSLVRFKYNINKKINVAPKDIFVNIDQKEIRGIINNILLNAKDALLSDRSLENKQIEIDISVTTLPNSDGEKQQYVKIDISNNGPPIEEEIKDKIFTPYYSTKTSQGGSGLGLAHVDKILEYHEGYINVISNNDKTSFILYIPIVEIKDN